MGLIRVKPSDKKVLRRFLFPKPVRTLPYARVWNITFRIAHIAVTGIVLGGHAFKVDQEQLLTWALPEHIYGDRLGGDRSLSELSLVLPRPGGHFAGQVGSALLHSFLDITLFSTIDPCFETSRRGILAVGDVHGGIKLIAAWAEAIQTAICLFKEITSLY